MNGGMSIGGKCTVCAALFNAKGDDNSVMSAWRAFRTLHENHGALSTSVDVSPPQRLLDQ